jgi:hypothetical protein
MDEKQSPDLDRIKAMVEARIQQEQTAGGGNGNDKKKELEPGFIKDCLYANQMGDGILYSALFLDQFIYNKSSKEWRDGGRP